MNKNNKKLELTAPAGGMNQLMAAVNAGADSVYLAYKKFGARAYADNFDLNGLKKAVRFSHNHNVKVYLTLNTLIKDNEIKEVLEFLREYTAICTDGIIIQDFCVFKIIKDLFKNIPVHASTQLNIHNVYSLRLLNHLGIKRAILTREMTLDEIKSLCKENLTEVEVFVHGSQCYSYSGCCYFSSFIGGRSGNRGRCTQPCRMKYKLLGKINDKYKYVTTEECYILSKSDLYLLEFIPELVEAGVNALKIEGRMKSPEYVGIVTKIYRKYIDLYYKDPLNYRVDKYDFYKLSQIFSRELGAGYIKNKFPQDIISPKKSGSIGNFLGRVYRIDYEGKKGKKIKYIYIRSRWKIDKSDIIEIWTKKGKSRINIKDYKIISKQDKECKYKIKVNSRNDILEKDRVFKYFDKSLNDEAISLFKNKLDKDISLTSSSTLKRGKQIIMVDKSKTDNYLRNFLSNQTLTTVKSNDTINPVPHIYSNEFLDCSVIHGVKRIIYSDFRELSDSGGYKSDTIRLLKRYNKNNGTVICVDTPQILYDSDFISVKNNILKLINEGIRNFRVSNYGVLELLLEVNKNIKSNINIYLSSSFNLFNTPALVFFNDLTGKDVSLKGIEFSIELNLKEISGIISNIMFKKLNLNKNNIEFSIFGHGYIQIINSRYKLEFITGKKDRGRYYLEDIKGYKFPVTSDYNDNIIIFNSKNICTLYDLEKVKNSGINSIIIDSRFYNLKDFSKILKSYREAINILCNKDVKKYENFTSKLQNDNLFLNYSKGHLFRGVE